MLISSSIILFSDSNPLQLAYMHLLKEDTLAPFKPLLQTANRRFDETSVFKPECVPYMTILGISALTDITKSCLKF